MPIKSPKNASKVKQIIRLVIAKKLAPIEFLIAAQKPVELARSTIAAYVRKPITEAPTKMNVILHVFFKVDRVNLM